MAENIWTKVTVRAPSSLEDPLSDFLTTLTGRGVGVLEEGATSTIEAYLAPGELEDKLLLIESYLSDLVRMGLLPEGSGWETRELPEEDWMAVFRSQHSTVRISPGLVVRPTWCEPLNGREIVLDPGMAFGTGSHATTRMCLLLLDRVIKDPAPRRMFDLGTGSGILAIAGAHLGIREVLAVDIDATAVQVAVRNISRNKVGDRIRVMEGGVETAEGLYDIIAANISAPLLRKLAPSLAAHVKPGGHLILSGILEDEWAEVRDALEEEGLVVKEVLKEKVWVAALFYS